MTTKKALILSAGGGRGAFAAGAVAGLVECGWMADGVGPDYLAGTSIGSVNAAAIASGKTVEQLYRFWTESIRTDTVHEHGLIGPSLPLALIAAGAFSPPPLDDSAVLSPEDTIPVPEPSTATGIVGAIASRLRDVFLHDPQLITSTWERAVAPLALDWERINSAAAPDLLVVAADVQSGEPVVFSNRATERPLGPQHLAASASIQILYQPTDIDGRLCWDGAVVQTTPLDPLLDHLTPARYEETEIVAVMMSPWITRPADKNPAPTVLYDTLAPALDWMMQASYRSAVKRLSDRYLPGPTVIAPDYALWREYLNIDRLVLYDPDVSAYLWEQGRVAAVRALEG